MVFRSATGRLGQRGHRLPFPILVRPRPSASYTSVMRGGDGAGCIRGRPGYVPASVRRGDGWHRYDFPLSWNASRINSKDAEGQSVRSMAAGDDDTCDAYSPAASWLPVVAATLAFVAQGQRRQRGELSMEDGGRGRFIRREMQETEILATASRPRTPPSPIGPPTMFGSSIFAINRSGIGTGASLAAGTAKRRFQSESYLNSGEGANSRGEMSTTEDEHDGEGESINLDDRENCPVCAKFSRGPCGPIFKRWLSCTDRHGGTNPDTGEDWHLTRCENEAERLALCLEEHGDYYDSGSLSAVSPAAVEGVESETITDADDIRTAWEDLIVDVEGRVRRRDLDFPAELEPDIEVHLETRRGVATFVLPDDVRDEVQHRNEDRSASSHEGGTTPDVFVLAYVRDQDGRLLAAGTREDVQGNGWNALRFDMDEGVTEVAVYALYDASSEISGEEMSADEDGPYPLLYVQKALLPSR